MTVLEKILVNKKRELKESERKVTLKELEAMEFFFRDCISLSDSISDKQKSSIVAEFKRKSPSKGFINTSASVEEVTAGYSRHGASGISVLTDHAFFGGNIYDLMLARRLVETPILRKDFIIDEYQVIESKAIGADAVLLIAAALDKEQFNNLSRLARSIGLQVLLEVHNEQELDYLNEYVSIAGVNNRDLKTLKVDTEISLGLAAKISDNYVRISESGISSHSIIRELREAGYNGFLIGEKFMSDADPVRAFHDFMNTIN